MKAISRRIAPLCGAALLALALAPASTEAQTHGLDGARMMHEMVRGHIMATANGVSADLYAYRPTDEVRSLGELLGHIGNASFMFCAAALGEDSPGTGDLEEADKAAMITGLEAAFTYCDRAYSEMGPDRLGEEVELFGMSGSRLFVLIFNASHNWEHYGNLVTYMRMNDLVPPSSGGMQGGM
jgi:uncharacterized damage-inducible protein DinB